jgi:exodeoxyribonuclease III
VISIVSWNVNSIKARFEIFLKWLEEGKYDIICLQEIKCIDEQFPKELLDHLGYNIVTNGQKTYNGVAILSKFPFEEVITDFPNNPNPEQKRYLEVVVNIANQTYRIVNVYVPNGQEIGSDKFSYKMNFYDALYEHAITMLNYDEPILIAGDYNVAPEDIDVYDHHNLKDSICFSIGEKEKFRKFIYNGYNDPFRVLYPNKQEFSWWDYRAGSLQKNHGLRIDHILVSNNLVENIIDLTHDVQVRNLAKSSDHCPVILTIK